CHRSSAHAADDEERNSLTSPGSRRRIDRRPSEDAAAEDDPDAEDDCAAEDDPMEDDCHRLRCGVPSPLQGYVPYTLLACRRLPSRRQTTSDKDFRDKLGSIRPFSTRAPLALSNGQARMQWRIHIESSQVWHALRLPRLRLG
ncbi:hypothetical protein THAOC_26401, partial [Thalassiosira oceanica]